ncbi:hypothetical protein GCM10009740_14300 [Terrabacter terrae]|uniref:Histidine kinase/HSP90-like ATPase domain-containing protein n=1 Tax=Terrabacter terrae TaxID=318434 RepID=A0ABN2TZ20_9MICO
MAQAIVSAHNGTVQADSAGLGQGARFTIKLPITPPTTETTARRGEPRKTSHDTALAAAARSAHSYGPGFTQGTSLLRRAVNPHGRMGMRMAWLKTAEPAARHVPWTRAQWSLRGPGSPARRTATDSAPSCR